MKENLSVKFSSPILLSLLLRHIGIFATQSYLPVGYDLCGKASLFHIYLPCLNQVTTLVGVFPGHCKNSRRFVDSSSGRLLPDISCLTHAFSVGQPTAVINSLNKVLIRHLSRRLRNAFQDLLRSPVFYRLHNPQIVIIKQIIFVSVCNMCDN